MAAMESAQAEVGCPRCGFAMGPSLLIGGATQCPSCSGGFEAVVFHPPEPRPVRSLAPGAAAESACPSHPANAAVANCDRCGVFMCDLCRIDADDLALCPACFDRLSSEGALESTRTKFHDYSRQSLTYVVVGLLFWVLAPLISPFAIYYGVRALRDIRARGETEGRGRAWLAIILAALELVGMSWLLYAMFSS